MLDTDAAQLVHDGSGGASDVEEPDAPATHEGDAARRVMGNPQGAVGSVASGVLAGVSTRVASGAGAAETPARTAHEAASLPPTHDARGGVIGGDTGVLAFETESAPSGADGNRNPPLS